MKFFLGTVSELKEHVLYVERDFGADCDVNSVRSLYLPRFQISLPTQTTPRPSDGFFLILLSNDRMTMVHVLQCNGYRGMIH